MLKIITDSLQVRRSYRLLFEASISVNKASYRKSVILCFVPWNGIICYANSDRSLPLQRLIWGFPDSLQPCAGRDRACVTTFYACLSTKKGLKVINACKVPASFSLMSVLIDGVSRGIEGKLFFLFATHFDSLHSRVRSRNMRIIPKQELPMDLLILTRFNDNCCDKLSRQLICTFFLFRLLWGIICVVSCAFCFRPVYLSGLSDLAYEIQYACGRHTW